MHHKARHVHKRPLVQIVADQTVLLQTKQAGCVVLQQARRKPVRVVADGRGRAVDLAQVAEVEGVGALVLLRCGEGVEQVGEQGLPARPAIEVGVEVGVEP